MRLKKKMKLGNGWIVVFAALTLLCGSLIAIASPSTAAPIETAYTLASDVGPISPTGASVSILAIPGSELLNGITFPPNAPGVCLDGVCDSNTQDWVVFRVSVLSGDIGQLGVSLLNTFTSGMNALGLGYFREDGPLQDGSGGTATYTGTIGDPDVPIFNFQANGGGAGITGTSLALFVAYADGSLPQSPVNFPNPPFGLGAAQFMVSPFGSAAIASSNGHFTTSIDIIPEPSVAVLLGLGMAALSARRVRREV
jgi:hypothetical protein